MRARLKRSSGFTLVEILIVACIIGMIATIAIPNFVKSRTAAQQKSCIANLSTMEAAKQLWGVETGKKNGDVPLMTDLVGPMLYLKVEPACPSGGTYTLGAIGAIASCSVPSHTL